MGALHQNFCKQLSIACYLFGVCAGIYLVVNTYICLIWVGKDQHKLVVKNSQDAAIAYEKISFNLDDWQSLAQTAMTIHPTQQMPHAEQPIPP